MKLPRRNFLHLAAGAAALPVVSRVARAQTYPTRPVRIIAGFPPSGFTDTTARLIGQWLSERLGQQFFIPSTSPVCFIALKVSRFNDRVGTRMSPASLQSVRPSSSTSKQTATSRRVPRDHSGTPRAISTPMPLRGMRCRLPSGLLLTVLSRPSKWIGSCLRTPISSAASALSHSMIVVLDEIRLDVSIAIAPFALLP